MDRDWYINECLQQLNDLTFYRPLDNDITDDIQKRSMYTQIWNIFGQRPILQLLQKESHFIQVCWKKMRSRQRIHGIQDTAPSLELRIPNSGEASAPVNIDRTGRENERDNSKNKTRHRSTGEDVTPLNISGHVSSEHGRQRQTKTRNTEPIKGHHSSRIWWLVQESSISAQLKSHAT